MPKKAIEEYDSEYAYRTEQGDLSYDGKDRENFSRLGKRAYGIETPEAGFRFLQGFKGSLKEAVNSPVWQGPKQTKQRAADVIQTTGAMDDLYRNPIFRAAVLDASKGSKEPKMAGSAASQLVDARRKKGISPVGRGIPDDPKKITPMQRVSLAAEPVIDPAMWSVAGKEAAAFWKGFGKGAWNSAVSLMHMDPNRDEYEALMENISRSQEATRKGGTTFKEKVVGGVPLRLGGEEITQRKPWKYASTYSEDEIRKFRARAVKIQPKADLYKFYKDGEKMLKSHFDRPFIEGIQHDAPEMVEGMWTLMRASVGLAAAPTIAVGKGEGTLLNEKDIAQIIKSREDMGKALVPGLVGHEASFWNALFSKDADKVMRAHPIQTALVAMPLVHSIKYSAMAGNLTAAKIMSSPKVANRLHKLGAAGEKVAAAVHFAQSAPGASVEKIARAAGVDVYAMNRATAVAEIANKGIDRTANAIPIATMAYGILGDYVEIGGELEKFSTSVAATIAAPKVFRAIRAGMRLSETGARADAFIDTIAQWLGDDSTASRFGSVREASEWATANPSQARTLIEVASNRASNIIVNEPVDLARAGVATKTSILTFTRQAGFDALTELLGPEYKGYLKPDPPTPQMKLGLGGKDGAEAQGALDLSSKKPWTLNKSEYSDYKNNRMSAAEFEATGEELFHGTPRSFTKFDAKRSKEVSHPGRWKWWLDSPGKRKKGPKRMERFYFTDSESAANIMADAGGYKQIDARHLFPGQSSTKPLIEAINKQLKAGNVLAYVDDKGNLVRAKSFKDIPRRSQQQWMKRRRWDIESKKPSVAAGPHDIDIRIYDKGHWPNVIKTKVYGKTLDLTDPKKIPESLKKALEKEGVFKPWEPRKKLEPGESINLSTLQKPDFERQSGGHRRSHELIRWARENGYGKITFADEYVRGLERLGYTKPRKDHKGKYVPIKSTIALQEYIAQGADPYKTYLSSRKVKYNDKQLATMRRKDVLKALQDGHAVPDSILKEVGVNKKVKPILKRLRDQPASFREPTKKVVESDVRKSLSGLDLDPDDIESAVKAIVSKSTGVSEAEKVLVAVRKLYDDSVSELDAILSRVADPKEMLDLLPLWRSIVKSRIQKAIKSHVALHEPRPLPRPKKIAREVVEEAAKKKALPENVSYIPHGTRLFVEYSSDAVKIVDDVPDSLKRVPGRLVDTLTNNHSFEEAIKWIADTANKRVDGGREPFARTNARARIIFTNMLRDDAVMLLHDPVFMGKVRHRYGRRLGLKGKELEDFAASKEIRDQIKKALDGAFDEGGVQDITISLKRDVDALVAKGMDRKQAVAASGKKLKFITKDVIEELMKDKKAMAESRAKAFNIAMTAHARDVQFTKAYGVLEHELTKFSRGKRSIPSREDIDRAGLVPEGATQAQKREATRVAKVMGHDRERYMDDVLESIGGDPDNLPLAIQVDPKDLLNRFDEEGSSMWSSEYSRKQLRFEIEKRYTKPSPMVQRLQKYVEDKIKRDVVPSEKVWIRKSFHNALDAQATVMMASMGEDSITRVVSSVIKNLKLAKTAYSPPTIARNLASNIIATVMESPGIPGGFVVDATKGMMEYNRFVSGAMKDPLELSYWKGMVSAGVASTDLIDAEVKILGTIKAYDALMSSGKGAPGQIKKAMGAVLKAKKKVDNSMQKGYAGMFGDGPFKMLYAYRDMSAIRSYMSRIKNGEYLTLSFEGVNRGARLLKTEKGWSHKGKLLSQDELGILVGKAAVKSGMDLFHNYQRVNIALNKLRAGVGGAAGAFFTNFPTWAWKSVFNEYRGMLGAILHSEGGPKVVTNNVGIIADKIKSNAALSVRRSLLMGSIQNTLYGDSNEREWIRRAYSYGDHPLAHAALATGMKNSSFLLDNLASVDFMSNTVAFVRVASSFGDKAYDSKKEQALLMKKDSELSDRERRLKRVIVMRRSGELGATEDALNLTGFTGGFFFRKYKELGRLEKSDRKKYTHMMKKTMIEDVLPSIITGIPIPALRAAYLETQKEVGFQKPETFFQSFFDLATTLGWDKAIVGDDGKATGHILKLQKKRKN